MVATVVHVHFQGVDLRRRLSKIRCRDGQKLVHTNASKNIEARVSDRGKKNLLELRSSPWTGVFNPSPGLW
jgi:hypothetical protein